MLDIRYIRENKDIVVKGVIDKGYKPDIVDIALEIDAKRRELIQKVDSLRAEKNTLTKDDAAKGKDIKEKLKNKEPELKELEAKLTEALHNIPNPPLDIVPRGKHEDDNLEHRKWGTIPQFDFTPLDHVEIGKKLKILDFDNAAKMAGANFVYLVNEGAMLELALIKYCFDELLQEGFTPIITPDVAKSRFYLGTGYMPKGDEAQTYKLEDEDLGLIATAEVTLAARHADEAIPHTELPIKYIGYSHCFRRESGAYGKYSKGLYRMHQFTKAEMFVYCLPEESEKMHELLLALEEKIFQGLEIPYRVLEMCTGDLGAMAARKFDLEAWMPGRGGYGEVTSTSNCTDYQARNLNIKYKNAKGETDYIHMLNGTACATSRAILAILEVYQQKDGSVKMPKVLHKYLGFDVINPK